MEKLIQIFYFQSVPRSDLKKCLQKPRVTFVWHTHRCAHIKVDRFDKFSKHSHALLHISEVARDLTLTKLIMY